MKYEDDDIKYQDVIKTLKSLPQVKAPAYFEADLKRRINSGEFEKEEKQSFWERFFVPSRLIPSAGLAVAAILLLFVFNTDVEDSENPLLIDPRVREDVTTASAEEVLTGEEYVQSEVSGGTKVTSPQRSEQMTSRSFAPESAKAFSGAAPVIQNAGYTINKSGLNFRQINLSDEERAALNELKAKIKNMIRKGNN